MKRVVVDAPHRLELREADTPAPGAGEALLRPLAIGICGSDLHVLEGKHPFVGYPVLPGHEIVAEVVAVGEGSEGGEGLRGARVALEPSLACGVCRHCRAGRYNICERLEVMGFQAPGGMAEGFVAPLDRLHRLPEGMSVAAGALVEPTAVATHATRLVGPLEGLEVTVVGAGTIGLLCAQTARAQGAAGVRVADVDPERRALAASFGFEAREGLDARSFDVAFECVGVGAALRSCVAAARKGATIAVVGVYGDDPPLQAGLVQDWELTLQGCLMYTGEDYREAIRLLREGHIDSDAMVSERFPLAEVGRAFALAGARGRTLKVLLEP